MTNTIPSLCASVAGKASGLGVAIHDAGYRALNLSFKYVAIETADLRETVRALKALNVRGFGVSMPYKADVIRLLDRVSDDVTTLNACNTVVNDSGRLHGFNTDWRGAMDALTNSGVTSPSRALVVGSGGVARALVLALKTLGWHVTVSARNRATAKDLCSRFGLGKPLPYPPPADNEVKLIVNATPDASYPNGSINLDHFRGASALFDVVFTPPKTSLAEAGQKRGLVVVPGWQMLLHQAAHQFKLYTGREAPIDAMKTALKELLGEF